MMRGLAVTYKDRLTAVLFVVDAERILQEGLQESYDPHSIF
jgi:hypothetical protein